MQIASLDAVLGVAITLIYCTRVHITGQRTRYWMPATSLGYEVVVLPKVGVTERADFVLKMLSA